MNYFAKSISLRCISCLFFLFAFWTSGSQAANSPLDVLKQEAGSTVENLEQETQKGKTVLHDISNFLEKEVDTTFSFLERTIKGPDLKSKKKLTEEDVWFAFGKQALTLLLMIGSLWFSARFIERKIRSQNYPTAKRLLYNTVSIGLLSILCFLLFQAVQSIGDSKLITIYFFTAFIFACFTTLITTTLVSYYQVTRNKMWWLEVKEKAPALVYWGAYILVFYGFFLLILTSIPFLLEPNISILYKHINSKAWDFISRTALNFYPLLVTIYLILLQKRAKALDANATRWDKIAIKPRTKRMKVLAILLFIFAYGLSLVLPYYPNFLNLFKMTITTGIFFLVLLLNHPIWTMAQHLGEMTRRSLPRRLVQIFGKEEVDHTFQVIYRLLAFLAEFSIFMYIWNIDSFFEALHSLSKSIATKVLIIFVIMMVTSYLEKLLSQLISGIMDHRPIDPKNYRLNSRFYTLMAIARTVLPIIWLPALLMILFQFGVDGTYLFATVGFLAVAVGFGAKAIVEDVIRGFFLILEDTLAINDHVTLNNGISGRVERLTLQSIFLRDYSGVLHNISYSRLNMISNNGNEFVYSVIEVNVAYDSDVDKAMSVMKEVCQEMIEDPQYRDMIMEPMDMSGVEDFEDSAIKIKARIKVYPLMQWIVRREYNRRLKIHFDQEGISMPFPQREVYIKSADVLVSPVHSTQPSKSDIL
jgi:small-conductance mechanosensitive channel